MKNKTIKERMKDMEHAFKYIYTKKPNRKGRATLYADFGKMREDKEQTYCEKCKYNKQSPFCSIPLETEELKGNEFLGTKDRIYETPAYKSEYNKNGNCKHYLKK